VSRSARRKRRSGILRQTRAAKTPNPGLVDNDIEFANRIEYGISRKRTLHAIHLYSIRMLI
jgi:hypothetical protein